MPKVEVVNLNREKVGELELADEVFAARVNRALLYEAVRHYLAGRRAGTHKTKVRSEVSGSGKKPWRQKGTGRARVGSIRSPLWRHGGTVHGPQPRDYSYHLPKKMLLGALRSALTAKVAEQKLTVVDALRMDSHKTRDFRRVLERFEIDRSVLLVDTAEDRNLLLSRRNLQNVGFRLAREVHPYDLLQYDRVWLSQPAAQRLQEALRP
ncbi:MAG: 50S ribosomal protein L4 [Acidobacteria bacterium]|jgi:large subunit ribosomal protein L4|nr:50S ribosomal protein L4 [Acidobacteriota bacterium]